MTPTWLYDAAMRVFAWLGLDRLRRRLVEDARGRVLEVGIGTGLNARFFGRAAWPVGIDPDRAGLLAARRRGARRLVVARAEALPFRDGAFDEVVFSLTLCTIPEPRQALGEAVRVVRPGGLVRFLEHVRPPGLLGRLAHGLTPAWRHVAGGCHLDRATDALVREEGLTLEGERRFLRGFGWEARARRT